MKKTLIAVLTLLLTATLFLPHTFAQAARPIVRLIYFVPKDVQPRPDINAQLDTHIKGVQRFLADEMERHGFGRKTFQLETDVHGNAVVHHLKGQAADAYYREDPFGTVSDEILEQFGRSDNTYLVALDRKREIVQGFELCGVQPQAGTYGWNEGGAALIPAGCLEEWFRNTTAHELLHTFGLEHDFRDTYIMGGGAEPNRRLSQCAAEWLDVHRAFNAGQTEPDEPATIEMLPPRLASPPNAIRLRFRITDADGLHQAQILKADYVFTPGNPEMIGYKRLDGTSRTVEFVTTALVPKSPWVTLQVIDTRGYFRGQSFPIDLVPLLPPAKVVSIPDANLAAAVRETLQLAPGDALTTQALLELTFLEAPNRGITALTGLEHAHNLRYLNLGSQERNGKWRNSNVISDLAPLSELAYLDSLILARPSDAITDPDFIRQPPPFKVVSMPDPNLAAAVREALEMPPDEALTTYTLYSLTQVYAPNRGIRDLTGLEHAINLEVLDLAGEFIEGKGVANSNAVTDISPLQTLTQLKELWLGSTSVSDVTALQTLTQLEVLGLDSSSVSDVSPLLGLNLTGTSWSSIGLYLWDCPLSYVSIHTHIPAMQAKGIEVAFNNVAHPALLKSAGDRQIGAGGTALKTAFVVETMDEHGKPIVGKPIQFEILEGGGMLSAQTAKTDARGKAQITLTLGRASGINKVKATAQGIQSWVLFTAVGTDAAPRLAADVNGDGVVNILDLTAVSGQFGETGDNRADVNGDGAVNIQDLVMVAGAFGEDAAAPSARAVAVARLKAADVEQWLSEARSVGGTSLPRYASSVRRGIAVLEQLLATLIPEKTALLPNYPNPFNPETWIPYQLAKPAEVTVTIYAANGAVVRTLPLGHQRAGSYESRSHAAYWDGRNEIAERVASGVYFYTLQAGDFVATRKMLILK